MDVVMGVEGCGVHVLVLRAEREETRPWVGALVLFLVGWERKVWCGCEEVSDRKD